MPFNSWTETDQRYINLLVPAQVQAVKESTNQLGACFMLKKMLDIDDPNLISHLTWGITRGIATIEEEVK